MAGLCIYSSVWNEYFASINMLNISIGGDHVDNVLWQAINLPLPMSVKNVVILCVTNNIPIDTSLDIADCIISSASLVVLMSVSVI